MHAEALEFIGRYATDSDTRVSVLDLGGRFVNGSPRWLFPNSDYRVVDIRDGDNVDIVADAATWVPDRAYDIVIAAELFEHTAVWPQICQTAHRALAPGGLFIVTCAGPGRPAHSAIDGAFRLHPGEYYANVAADDLRTELIRAGFAKIEVEFRTNPCDTRAAAWKDEADGNH